MNSFSELIMNSVVGTAAQIVVQTVDISATPPFIYISKQMEKPNNPVAGKQYATPPPFIEYLQAI